MAGIRKFAKVVTPVLFFVFIVIVVWQLGIVPFLNPIMVPLMVVSGISALVMCIVCVIFERE